MFRICFDKINELIIDGYIRKNNHSNGDLFIYNYTPKAQYERIWTPETLQCRGLICDSENKIIARPFPKFFNLSEYQDKLPTESFEIYEKLDGSLGILYFYEDKPFIATRGSFDSIQAKKAQEMLSTIYKDAIPLFDKNFTYLFEIIYPANRIVVDYGNVKSLILLGVIDTITGEELPINEFEHLGFPIVKKYEELKKIEELTELNEPNQEGFVIRFSNGFRIKLKFSDYVKLHKLITEVTSKKIWELLKDQIPFDNLLEKIPDEIYQWIHNTANDLRNEYNKIEVEAQLGLDYILNTVTDRSNRKELAQHIVTYQYPSILFSMLDQKDYSNHIWKIIEPEHKLPIFDTKE